ncbi:gcn5-like N-acetyltransferase [Strigomonas culicis]|uniref:Gcn5-like N-acetyltransferase n=1 Tax=Strigomonas culicis TaxID=28005 RepID=S9TEE1_9TRYP|nr:gcn5-like N-acetyltransferase [Strigomonas culicis]|eukprot:EPY16422.1 gcn5-like N-acetyltransferase [Strigomonas culicis]
MKHTIVAMTEAHIPAVLAIQSVCYSEDFIERYESYQEKLKHNPDTCFVCLARSGEREAAVGYIVALQTQRYVLPSLDSTELAVSPLFVRRAQQQQQRHAPPSPDDSPLSTEEEGGEPARVIDTLYIHDIALHPDHRGGGRSQALVYAVLDQARRLAMPHVALVAVAGADRYWTGAGFEPQPTQTLPRALQHKLQGYGDAAVYMELPPAARRQPPSA